MRLLARLLRAVVALVLAIGLAVAAGAGVISWRLAQGPLDVTDLAQRVLARYAPVVQVAHVSLAWAGFDRGTQGGGQQGNGQQGLHVVAGGVQAGQLQLRRAAVALAWPPLLRGEVTPSDVTLDGLRLQLTRAADGAVQADGVPASAGESNGSSKGVDPLDRLRALRHLALHDATITLRDAASGQSAQIGQADADLTRGTAGFIAGHAEASLATGDVSLHATLAAQQDPDGTTLKADLSPISPAALAHLDPALAPLAMFDAAITAHAQAALTPALGLRHAAIQAQIGPGTVLLPARGGGSSAAHFASATLDAEGDLAGVTIHALRLVVAPSSGAPPTTIAASATAHRAAGKTHADIVLDIDHLALADLPAVWPRGTGGGARPWLTENLVAGRVHDGHFKLGLDAGSALDDVDLVSATGTMTGDDVTMYWLRPVPPIEHGDAVLTLETPDALTVVFTNARQGNIVEKAGNIHITGMATPHQFGLINTDLAAPIPDVIKLLSIPKLQILSAHPLPLKEPRGDTLTHLTVTIPLEEKVEFDDVKLHAVSRLTRVHLGLVSMRNLDQGDIAMDVTNDGLTANGTALLARIPAKLDVEMDFRKGPPGQQMQHVGVSMGATGAQLAQAGLDTAQFAGGPFMAKGDYTELRDGRATAELHADLGKTAVNTPFGWSKTADTPGIVEVRARLVHGRLASIDRLRAEAPDLSIEGHSDMAAGQPSVLHLDRANVGRTAATGTIQFARQENEPIRIRLAGPRLDLSELMDNTAKDPQASETPVAPPSADPKPPQRFDVNLQFAQVVVKDGRVGPVALTGAGSVQRIDRALLTIRGPQPLRASVTPTPAGRRVDADAADLGGLLAALGITRSLAGGHLTLTGAFDDRAAGAPLSGVANVSEFRVRGAPAIGKVLQALTLYGLMDALRGPGLVFDRLAAPFRLTDTRLVLHDARAFSSSLGLTVTGELDRAHDTIAAQGTIVPAYALNTLPGRIPLVGRLFSPEKGGGVFAATFTADGRPGDPKIGFNPVAALTPGIMRRVFNLFD